MPAIIDPLMSSEKFTQWVLSSLPSSSCTSAICGVLVAVEFGGGEGQRQGLG